MATAKSFYATLDYAREAKVASGGSLNVVDFLHELEKLARQAIDTAEERKAIADAAMKFYDQYVNSLVPAIFQEKTRAFVADAINAALVAAAGA